MKNYHIRRRIMAIDYDLRRRIAALFYEFFVSMMLGLVVKFVNLKKPAGGIAAADLLVGTISPLVPLEDPSNILSNSPPSTTTKLINKGPSCLVVWICRLVLPTRLFVSPFGQPN